MNYINAEEALVYGSPDDIRQHLENAVSIQYDFTQQMKQINRSIEITEEQLYFARELLEEIQIVIETNTKYKDVKSQIDHLFANSHMEL
jgi:hypothetical protein